jgi:hypothetical protein
MGTILTMTPGINLFMSLYSLTVFLETPEPQRKGRKRYIVASFMITVLFLVFIAGYRRVSSPLPVPAPAMYPTRVPTGNPRG